MTSNRQCHRCEDGKSFLLNAQNRCYTCDGKEVLSKQHSELFDVGFSEEVNLGGDYSMELYRDDERGIVDVQVKCIGGNFVIVHIRLKSSTANDDMIRIHNVDELIKFLKK